MSQYLPCVEIGHRDPQYAIIWLHGLGADGHDFEPVAAELKLNFALRYIFPHAPEIPVTVNNGVVMPAWYDILSPQIDKNDDEAGIRHSEKAIQRLIEREIERGIKSDHIILIGFSQGGAIALHTGLRYPEPLAGIISLSAYLPLVHTLENEIHRANQNTPIKLAHGEHDHIVPFHLAKDTQHILERLHYQTELKTYAMEHGVCPDEIQQISAWITTLFT